MTHCDNCGHYNQEDALFCGKCGTRLAINDDKGQNGKSHEHKEESEDSWIGTLNEYIGNDKPAELNWKMLFTDVFKHHTREEAERIFICGTKTTTPNITDVSRSWPRPWLYSRVLLLFLATFGLLWTCVAAFDNINALPGMIVVGSFAFPSSVMILFLEANVWRNVSLYHVLMTFFIGGCAALVVTLFLMPSTIDEIDFFHALMIGVVEELGKAVIIFVFLSRMDKPSILSGMLVGAAVGAGFAAFESAGYALQPFIYFQQAAGYAAAFGQMIDGQEAMEVVNHVIIMRGLLAPGGHVAWAAITGAAFVIATKWKGGMDFSVFTNSKFLKLFAIPVALHFLWDSPIAEWCNELVPFSSYIMLIVLVWIVVLILINMGLAEVSNSKTGN